MLSYLLAGVIFFALLLINLVLRRTGLLAMRGGRLLSFLALFILPILITAGGAAEHLAHAKTTVFCLSCHEMQPYGESLWLDDASSLPAAHFQNRRIPRDQACYTCHTSYTMFGNVEAKLKGLVHLWVHFTRDLQPGEIELYQPFANRECLHCHGGARSFVENPIHTDLLAALESGELGCLGCHATTHDVMRVGEAQRWQAPTGGPLGEP